MNLGYIKSEIYNLGFSVESDTDPKIVIQAINRAIDTIANTVRPIVGVYKISQYPLKNNLQNNSDVFKTHHYNGTSLEFTGEGVSYYFECDGTGTAVINDDNGNTELVLNSNKKFVSYKGFCKGKTIIIFNGQFSYNVKNIAIYSEKTSDEVNDIPPFCANYFYDFKEIAKDKNEVFIDFLDKYESSINGFKNISDFDILNRHIIRLPAQETVEYEIYYKKLYTPITEQTKNDVEIELDPDLHVLVPLLAAFYVWQDDEERKADKLYNDYETKRNDILGRETKVIAVVESGIIYVD